MGEIKEVKTEKTTVNTGERIKISFELEKTTVNTGERIKISFEFWYEQDYPYDYPHDYPIASERK